MLSKRGSKPNSIYFVVGLFIQLCLEVHHAHCHSTEDSLLWLLSFDGFRDDYLKMAKQKGVSTPNFDRLIKEGVIAPQGMQPAFITKTFPNHFTIATGLYEENHGVVNNVFYDPRRNVTINLKKDRTERGDSFWWNNGTSSASKIAKPGLSSTEIVVEPIWIANERASNKLSLRRSGVMMWPGCEVQYSGRYPSRYEVFDSALTLEGRINKVLDWFTNDIAPINLGLLYFEEPDNSGHKYGPDGEEIMNVIKMLDDAVGYILTKLNSAHLLNRMNLIFVSDHGMESVNATIALEKYLADIEPLLVEMVITSPIGSFFPRLGQDNTVYQKLQAIPNITVYRKDDIPDHYHYHFNDRIPPVMIVAKPGFALCENSSCLPSKGTHGYNNTIGSMQSLFIAHGPAFQKGSTAEDLKAVDVYRLMCEILDLEVLPSHHESLSVLNILEEHTEESHSFSMTAVTFLLAVLFCTLCGGICCVAACRTFRASHRHKLHHLVPMVSANGLESTLPLVSSDEEI